MNYFENLDSVKKIKGYDLKIDNNVQKMCDLSNNSSTHTRWTFYILMIVSIISLIAIINTFGYGNWTKERITDCTNIYVENCLKYSKAKIKKDFLAIDSLASSKKIAEINLEKEIENKVKNIGIVQLPIIGNSFDVNNLAIITGLAFILILLVTRYTASREKKNLRIALHAITQRYPDPEDYVNEIALKIDLLPEKVLDINNLDYDKIIVEKQGSKIFNYTRRRYHYNYLSMNEIFNVPADSLDEDEQIDEKVESNTFKDTILARYINKYFLYTPFFVYIIIFMNDCFSFGVGFKVASTHAIANLIISYFLLLKILSLCVSCNNQKLLAQAYYDGFKKNYKFDKEANKVELHELKWKKIIHPIEILYKLILRKKLT